MGQTWAMTHTSIQISGDQVPAVLALPPAGSGPAVIVIQEWWGLVPHIVTVTERLAQAGFVAMAVDHYRGAATTEPDEAGKLMMGLDIEQVAADLAAAADYLLDQPQVSSSSVGVVGFCMGGGLALLAPTVSDGISCASAFYPAMPWPHYAPDWSRYAGKAAIVHKAVSDEPGMGPVIAVRSSFERPFIKRTSPRSRRECRIVAVRFSISIAEPSGSPPRRSLRPMTCPVFNPPP